MIEINLLPPELIKKKKRKIELPDVSFMPIVAGLLGVIIIIHLLISLTLAVKAKTANRLERKWKEILPQKETADKMKGELTGMRNKVDTIDNLIKNRRSWAQRMEDISDAMIPGVWLNKLWLEKRVVIQEQAVKSDIGEDSAKVKVKVVKAESKKTTIRTLHLSGSVIVAGGEETTTIAKFIRSLKENRDFFSDFNDIESASIQRTKLKDEEIMDFELICRFK